MDTVLNATQHLICWKQIATVLNTTSQYFLLPCIPTIRWAAADSEICSPGINVHAAASCKSPIHGEFCRLAPTQNIHEDALNALLVKAIVRPIADQVLQ